MTLTVISGASDPIVESKQHKQQRRYVVSNPGPIVKVDGRRRRSCSTFGRTKRPSCQRAQRTDRLHEGRC